MTVKTLIKDIALISVGVSAFALIALSPVLAYANTADANYGSGYSQTSSASSTISQGTFTGRSNHVTSGDFSVPLGIANLTK